MKYRSLGNTDIKVSEIGFGAWGIGGLTNGPTSYGKTDDAESRRALRKAYNEGITFFDTSDLYGYGHSEELVGEVFETCRDKVVIASKVGFLEHNGPQDFSETHIRRSVEGSLKRLRCDYLDLYQLHSPFLEDLNRCHVVDTLSSLQRDGKIRAYGISARSPDDALIAVKEYGFPVVQVNFNLVDQRAHDNGLFDACAERGVGVISRTPLCFGFLTGRYSRNEKFSSSDHRSTWSEAQIDRWSSAHSMFASVVSQNVEQTSVQMALRFCLSHETVSTVIPGMLNVKEVEENAAASDLGPYDLSEMRSLNAVHQNNEFFLGKAPVPGGNANDAN